MGILHLDVCKFFISPSVFLRMSNVLHNVSTEYQNTHFMFNNFADSRAIYDVEKFGTARQATEYNIIRPMRFAWWINKATDTHS